jgi:activator of 2-hydroxyglutaryl-CoA dehydratase
MKYAGIDIGSRTIEMVILESGKIYEKYQTNTGYDPVQAASQLLNGHHYDCIMATGYGRELFQMAYESQTVTEIKAYARGVKEIFPYAQTILDIGGQDSKAISLLNNGKIKK